MTPYLLAVVPAVLNTAVTQKRVPVRGIVAGFLYGIALAIIAGWRGDVAVTLAWLVALTSLLVNGATLFNSINKVV